MNNGVDVVASYDIGMFRVYIPVGFAMVKYSDSSVMAWNFSPYIRKDMDGITLWTGLMLFNGTSAPHNGALDPVTKSFVNWAIPFAVQWAW